MGEVQYAQNQPLTEERIRSQMEKLGNTEYEWENLEIQMDENIFIPMKMLNEARREALESLDSQMILFCAGINLMIAVMNQSGLGQVFGDLIIKVIGESRNLYLITAVLCIGASIATSFMNNMACAGMLAPVGISIANALGANPQAIVLAIAIGAGCSYLTPIASGTNQTMIIFTKLKFQDFAKFGWPLLIISWILCIAILPQVFPFF